MSGLLVRSPEDGITKDRCEGRIVEQARVVSHEDVDISGLGMFIRPDDRMVSHFCFCVRRVTVFIDAGQQEKSSILHACR